MVALFLGGSPISAEEGVEFFEKEIRPLLVAKCYDCHSSDAKTLKGGLYLDSRPGWERGGDSGPAVIPGKPEESLLIEAVRYQNSDLEMPPKEKLSRSEIDALVRWVEMGAPDPRVEAAPVVQTRQTGLSVEEGRSFWSYRAPVAPQPPVVRDLSWPRGEIDRFILAELEAHQLRPVADADRAALARRVYFDLSGLPPTIEELDRFVQDDRPGALERRVDALLNSPRFGERWGRHWLDVARYGESVTLRGLVFQNAWRYRDYVIDAFNCGMPYDQFVREQIAGDLLPGETLADRQRQLTATTFLTLGNTNLEEQDKKQLDMNVIDEQLDVIGKAFLAQTLGCARCHDHKFDPIPTRDYYAMAGILKGANMMKHANVSGWVERPLPLSAKDEATFREKERLIAQVERRTKDVKGRLAKFGNGSVSSTGVAARAFEGLVLDDSQARVVGDWENSQYTKPFIGDGYIHDRANGKGSKSVTFEAKLPAPGTYEVRLAYTAGANRAPRVPVTIRGGEREEQRFIDQRAEPSVNSHFVSLGAYRFEDTAEVVISTEGTKGHVIVDAVQWLGGDETISAALRKLNHDTDSEPTAELQERAALQTELKQLEVRLESLKDEGPERPMVMTVEEQGAGDIPVHIRGSVHTLGETVPRGFLSVATVGEGGVIPQDQSGRLQLAEWLVDRDNPLTARVFVNRVWLWLFGKGLVRTPDNFGTTGSPPTHPELLDWLAIRFMDEGWSIKWLVREIVLSHTYQLSSVRDEAAMRADPENRLYWRNDRRRLDAECIRDAMLAVGGGLDLEMGGRTFPESLSSDYGNVIDSARRSVYLPVFRNALPELFEAFDFANPSMVTGQRNVSTVAPQALFLMNNPFVRSQAEAAAARWAEWGGAQESRIERAYRSVLGRLPDARELALARQHLHTATDSEEAERWTELIQALFASIDFRYLR